ncbi:gastrokine-1 [Suncus etruscus]|uniref:gastrokine-1 n=1 Tax=Suncus etruscus TaxID=109475 RepID=UPI00210FA18B|nr:gastrokine-1 [Suncus etruscus]
MSRACLFSSLHFFGEAKMKFAIVFVGLLGVFLAPVLGEYDIDVGENNKEDVNGEQSVSVNHEHNLANIDNNNGWDSWNAILDYESNFAAIRLFKNKACIVHRMNRDAMPSLQALDALSKKNKDEGPGGPPPKGLMYSINPEKVSDVDRFGKAITGMCKGVPIYMAEETEGASLFVHSGGCLNINILWILRTSFCGGAQLK